VAVEGKCASGKTTLCEKLGKYSLLHTDDFFLPDHLRTEERINETGGNIHYEAIKELFVKLKPRQGTGYDKYDCRTKTFRKQFIDPDKIVILEGVYSYHPYFKDMVDYLIFVDTDDNTRDRRLRDRSMYQRFVNEWIPMENKYYDKYDIKYLSDIIV